MPPKASAPPMTRTLSSFFSKGPATSTQAAATRPDPMDVTLTDATPSQEPKVDHDIAKKLETSSTTGKTKERKESSTKPSPPNTNAATGAATEITVSSLPSSPTSTPPKTDAQSAVVPETPKKPRKKKETADPTAATSVTEDGSQVMVSVSIPQHERVSKRIKAGAAKKAEAITKAKDQAEAAAATTTTTKTKKTTKTKSAPATAKPTFKATSKTLTKAPSTSKATSKGATDIAKTPKADPATPPIPSGSQKSPAKVQPSVLGSASGPEHLHANNNSNGITASVSSQMSTGAHVLPQLSKYNKTDSASMFRIKNGKAFITESKLKFMSHPSSIADLCRFHEYRQSLQDDVDKENNNGNGMAVTPAASGIIGQDVARVGNHLEMRRIPSTHYGLIAKLVEESELLLTELASTIMAVLCPREFAAFEDFGREEEVVSAGTGATTATMETTDDGVDTTNENDMDIDVLDHQRLRPTTVSTTAIMEAIQAIAQRVNYGVPVPNLPASVTCTPGNLSVYRWEVQEIDQYFPPDMKAAVTKRRSKRMEASAALTAWFMGLEQKQKEDLCPIPKALVLTGSGGGGAAVATKRNRTSMGGGDMMDIDMEGSGAATTCTKMVKDGEDNGFHHHRNTVEATANIIEDQATVPVDPAAVEAKIKEIEAKKKEDAKKKEQAEAKKKEYEERRLEKERKMAERQHEKDIKEAERLQKEETKKQTSQRFVGFFKPVTSPVVKKEVSQSQTKNDAAPQSNALELFHPFHVKKNTTLAPINRFSKALDHASFDLLVCSSANMSSSSSKTPPSHDDMDVDGLAVCQMDHETAKATLAELFGHETLAAAGAGARGRNNNSNNNTDTGDQCRRFKKLPPRYQTMTVKELMQSGALVQDSDENMNEILTWRDIPALRMRLLQFAENYRPAYYGEECKSDDDDDDADDLGSEQEEEDDWLVPEGYLSEDEGLDAGDEGGGGGHKAESVKRPKEMKRPLVAHVAPIIVGPVFEMVLGEVSGHPALEPYHIEFIGEKNV
ncbi:hypothetical protein BG004_003786 [Podila humilis]|nr:hypothetical protein BG004_003786 [Podila humilis]